MNLTRMDEVIGLWILRTVIALSAVLSVALTSAIVALVIALWRWVLA
jgi:hypothetical protein